MRTSLPAMIDVSETVGEESMRYQADLESAVVPTLHTERLLLRAFRAEDIDAYAALSADPEVMRYLGDGSALSREDAWRHMALLVGHWQLRGFGSWAVEERATGAFVGRVGLHFPEGWPEREIGWTIARPYWGKGLAFEAAKVALEHAFISLDWPRIVSLIDPANAASIRLALRLGERLEREMEMQGHRVLLYSLEREAWLAAPPA
jgi:RimJ/RimL family protein N-acetyltransferase